MKIHVNDNVLVTTGKYKGKTGKVIRVYAKTGKVTVEKVNLRTRHIKKQPGHAGQKITYEAPFDGSNVMIICPQCSKASRITRLVLKTGGRQRICKKCDQSVDKLMERKKTKKR